jgi:type IV secretion system protein TrbG
MMSIFRGVIAALSCAACMAAQVRAQPLTDPIPLPTDSRIVTFIYSADAIFTILTLPGAHTHIELPPGEGLVLQPRLGDTIQWRLSGGPQHVFIKPTRHDIFTTATLVTNKRTYQLEFRSSPLGGKRYQKVVFQYPDDELALKQEVDAARTAVVNEAKRIESQNLSANADITQYRFGYSVDGAASWKPATVFDDGRFTYFQINAKAQDLPAFFILEDDGKATLVNHSIRGQFVVVQRLAPRFLLRLGNGEVKVGSPDFKEKSVFPFFRGGEQ